MNSDTTSAHAGEILIDVERLAAAILGVDLNSIEIDEPLGNLGFDSASLKLFAGRLSDAFDHPVDTVTLFTFPTLSELAGHLAESIATDGGAQKGQSSGTAESDLAPRPRHDIAIVGISCRLPGAATKEAFWQNQLAARNCIAEIPRRRWDWKDIHGDPLRENGRTDVKWGAFIEGEDRFPPEFFGISKYEAEFMDPQHRLFLMSAWEAIWDAGHDPGRLAGQSVGVFAGVQFQDYQKLIDGRRLTSAQACTGNAHAMIANRVSFLLNIHGPSTAIDTACSSSLVAVHNAVQAIRRGECDMALAGGVNLLLSPDMFIMGRQLGVLSPTGQCRTFDADADGYVRGEGVGVLFLKPYDQALRDRDHVYGVIRGTAINHGGRAASLTAPNSRAQAQLMLKGMDDAGMTPNDIGYVEMHGTGTELGDPIEIEAVKSAFRQMRADRQLPTTSCAVGSVKTNIGHLEPAAGVAGVINVIMAMQDRKLPGLSNFQSLNPHITLSDGLALQTSTGPWPSGETSLPLGGLVNSFGFGGANASVVIRQHIPSDRGPAEGAPAFIPLAAESEAHLRDYATALAGAVNGLRAGADTAHLLKDVAFTLQQRGGKWPCRVVLRVASLDALAEALDAIRSGLPIEGAIVDDAAMAEQMRLSAHVSAWLDTGECVWPDIENARRISLPIAPWPSRSCWFEPRPSDSELSRPSNAELIYLEPGWTGQPLRTEPRPWTHKCVWVIGRSDAQLAAFVPRLERECAGTATVITSVCGKAGLQPSLEVWQLSGAEPETVIVLPAEAPPAGLLEETQLVFGLARDLMEGAFNRDVDVFYLAAEDFAMQPATDAIPALAKSAFLENEHLRIHTLFFKDTADANWEASVLAEVKAKPPATPVALRFGPSRSVQTLSEAEPVESQTPAWFRNGGVYLIPGGAGELGIRLLERLAGDVDATFVVCGRSQPEDRQKAKIAALAARGPGRVFYLQSDIADIAQTETLIERILEEHHRLDGILNLVTAHDDAYLFRKSWTDFARIAASKVQGTINLDRATSSLRLDFFVAFSSLAALGLAGGSDYAYGCAFQNSFAAWRTKAVAAGRRHGLSKAICWSRWKWDKYVTPEFDAWFESLGFAFFDLDTGMRALRKAMGDGGTETTVLYADRTRVWHALDGKTALLRAPSPRKEDLTGNRLPDRKYEGDISPAEALVNGSHQLSAEGAASGNEAAPRPHEALLIAIIRDLLKIDDLDRNTQFSAIGLDSVMAIQLIVLVDKKLGYRLSPRELLRHQTVTELAAFLQENTAASDGDQAAASPQDTATILVEQLKSMLRSDSIATDAHFSAIGVDSIMAVKLASLLNQQFGVGISPRWFARFPTVDRMVEEIDRCAAERV